MITGLCHQDNGGYLGNGGDDTPLRGGKFSDFQGGVRVAAFAAGGLLPPAVRGGEVDGYIHICAHLRPAGWGARVLAAEASGSAPQARERTASACR